MAGSPRSDDGARGRRGRTSGASRRGGRPDPTTDPVAALGKPLAKVLERLPETQRRVLELRMGLADGHPHSQADTARALGIGVTEAREIETRAFDHIREVGGLEHLENLPRS